MKVGLWGARADDRGLGRITHDFYTHMRPDRCVVVDMGVHARGFTQHLDRYPDAEVTPFAGGTIAEPVMRRFFAGLDVAVLYETAYDHRAYTVARAAGCRTVLMAMPEFHRHLTERLPHPDVVWLPTCWRADSIPAARIVPVPVATPPEPGPGRSGRLRVLHVAGHRAAADRNGTLPFLRSLRALTENVQVRVTTQDRRPPTVHSIPKGVVFDPGGPDHWQLYRRADVLVMPRRYGGLCLPVQEALACGLAVVMTGCEPNPQTWPVLTIPTIPGTVIHTPAGPIRTEDPLPADIAAAIDQLAADPALVADLQARARAWAATHTWALLRPVYESELERAVGAAVAVPT